MGRKHLGGDSALRPNHRNKEYNHTLEHVYETAIANIDETHRKRKNHRKTRVPNLLSLCWKSAADDVVGSSSTGPNARDDLGPSTGITISSGDETKMDVAPATVVDHDDAIFLLKDDEVGQASSHRARSGLIRSTMLQATQSINSWQGRHKQAVYDASKR